MMLDWQCRLLEHYRGEMAEMGLEVVPSTDFEALEAIVRRMSQKGNGELTPHFSTRENTFTTQDAFWIGVWYEKRCIGVVASKLQSLGDEKLGAYIRRYWNRVYQAGSTHDFEMDDWQKEVLSSYSGDIIYSGEFRVHPEYQGKHFAEPMAMFLRVYSFLRWENASLFYIFMEDENARRGSLASRVQMTIQIPDALNWRVPPSQAKPDYWLCGMERDHYRDFVRQWAESQKPRVSTESQIAVIHRRS
ncbi:MAG: hypothetical protein ABJH63_13080 [Rhizobiaceae bacterium]